jgi:hypothetical protein
LTGSTLWDKGLLGDATPQTLLDTIIFYNRLFFALRSRLKHCQLRRDPCQIQVVEHPLLRYTEDISKNRPGGLKGRKAAAKVGIHHTTQKDSLCGCSKLFLVRQTHHLVLFTCGQRLVLQNVHWVAPNLVELWHTSVDWLECPVSKPIIPLEPLQQVGCITMVLKSN